jgi:hypothetical protein
MHVAAADLHDEQAVQAPECHRAVHMEVGGEHGRGLSVQTLPPTLTGSRFTRRDRASGVIHEYRLVA